MSDRAGVTLHWLLIGCLVVLVGLAPFLARRTEVLYAFVTVMVAAGGVLFLLWKLNLTSWRTVLVIAILLRALVFWLPPGLSDDAYRYVWDGQIQHQGENPYAHRPVDAEVAASEGTELYDRLNSREFYSVYPPLSQIVFWIGTTAITNWKTGYYAIKFIILLIEMLGVVALARLATPGNAILYAWNPLVIVEVAGQGHTEGLAAGLILLTLALMARGRPARASASLVAAGMAKLYPFVLMPLLWRRRGWVVPVVGGLIAALLALPYFEPRAALHILDSLRLYVAYFEFNAGPYYAVKALVGIVTGSDPSKVLGPVFALLFVLALPVVYYADMKHDWPLQRPMLAILSVFVLLSTTVHPWYLVPLLALVAVTRPVRWHWYWLGICSTGTYLLYVDGPYWAFVILGWTLWVVLATRFHHDSVLQWIQKKRGAGKFARIGPWLRSDRPIAILDLGAGEGYVGLAASKRRRGRVVLADVVEMNRTQLPFHLVGGDGLGFRENEFDYVILYFVLHHSAHPKLVLREAARVASSAVIVVESVYRRRFQERLLANLDRFFNRIRSGGRMRPQEEHLHFLPADEWRGLIEEMGLNVVEERLGGNWIHRQAMFLIQK